MIHKMVFGKFLFFVILLSTSIVSSQEIAKEVLFTINEKPYYTDEFARVYKKNLDLVKDDTQKDLDFYLDLFVGYKLKVNKAYKLGLQNNTTYQNELKSYRSQLAKNYFNDTKITEELIQEGYNRLQKEIRASHILILVDENAKPEDTLKAYQKANEIRKKALAGTDFNQLAFESSEDPSAKDNKGDLGYFTAFRMVYPFENAAYKTPVGQISNLVRTRFGYHIIKVTDSRANRGEVTVAHIMILNPKPEDADQDKAKNTINDIYKKINQGEKFEDLAKQFSEDKSSSGKGGVLNRFGSGQLSSPEFEDVAFSLTKPNEISQPFQSQFGWHIIKLIEKHALRTIDEMKSELENKISRDERSKKIVTSLNEKLRKKYTHKRDTKQFQAVSKVLTDDIYEGKWKLPADLDKFSGTLLTVNSTKNISSKEFLEFLDKHQKSGFSVKPLSRLAETQFDVFLDSQLNTYYDENLENEFPEFSHVMEEYRDGLLLFDLMEKEIWEKAKTDSIGLQNFYSSHKYNHMWKRRIEATVFSSTKKDIMEKVKTMLKKKGTVDGIKEKLNTAQTINVMSKNGIYEEGSDALPKSTQFVEGLSEVFKEGEYYYVVKVDKVLPETVKTLEECRGKMINDYQQFLEQKWVDDLKKEFNVRVNQDVFQRVKSKLKP